MEKLLSKLVTLFIFFVTVTLIVFLLFVSTSLFTRNDIQKVYPCMDGKTVKNLLIKNI